MKSEETLVKPKVIYENIVCYKGVKYNTLLRITAKEIILKKKKLFSDHYKTIKRVLINDILLKKEQARIILDHNDIIIMTKDEDLEFSAENKNEARRIVEIVYSLRTGKKFVEKKKDSLKVLKNTLVIGGIIAVIAGTYKMVEKNKKRIKETE